MLHNRVASLLPHPISKNHVIDDIAASDTPPCLHTDLVIEKVKAMILYEQSLTSITSHGHPPGCEMRA